MTCGVLIYAHNNRQIDYTLIAFCNALAIKHHLQVPVCLVTDSGSLAWLRAERGEMVDRVFDHIIIRPLAASGERPYHDTLSTTYSLPWHNLNRVDSYGLTPFDETLLIDADYLIMDDRLRLAWGSQHKVMINRRVIPLDHGLVPLGERWLEQVGIDLCWATCVYFRRSRMAEMLFDLVEHVRDNYQYYGLVYGFPPQVYRNDYAFSIAVHMLQGFTHGGDIPALPSPFLFTSFDCDELIDLPERDVLRLLVNHRQEKWRFRVTKVAQTSLHVMNKFSIVRQADKFVHWYGDAA